MGALEQITQLKGQGVPENQIIENLRQQGVSPKEITDALAQSQIKNAVAGENQGQTQGMEPSIMGTPPVPGEEVAPQGEQSLAPPKNGQEQFQPLAQETNLAPSSTQGQASQDQYQGYYPQEGYYEEYQGQESGSTDTMIEIAEQVFAEKIQNMQKQLQETIEFKKLAENKIQDMNDRLKRIENGMDRLQLEILGKIGSYGDSIQGIKKEMSMMQDTFGKALKKSSTPAKTTKRKTTSKKKE